MKRIILVLLGIAALAIVVVAGFQVVDVDGTARVLIIAGAVVLLVGVIDALRHPTLADLTAADLTAAGPTLADPVPTTLADPVPTTLADAVIDLRDTVPSVELRSPADLRPVKLPTRIDLIDQLVSDGLLRVVDGPISDDEAHTMVMVAVTQGAMSTVVADQRFVLPRLMAAAS